MSLLSALHRSLKPLDKATLEDCLVAACGPDPESPTDLAACPACEGAGQRLYGVFGKGVRWRVCDECVGTGRVTLEQ